MLTMPPVVVHNVGFYKLFPKSISCMSLEPVNKKLAVCRADATIEIWNIAHSPFIEKTLVGGTGIESGIESLAWCGNRLFSAEICGTVTEHDLYTLRPKYNVQVTSGAAWCLDVNKTKTHVAVGTEAGYINVFTINESDITFEKLLDKQEGRILCLKYDHTGQHIVTGSMDTVRIWNVKSGHAVHKMVTGRGQNNQETIVWCLAVLDDFTIISGDSRGKITFWDGNMGTYNESYVTHRADVLSICLTDDQKTIFCAGVDPNIISFAKVKLKAGNFKWVKSIQRKIHDHDVRTLVLAENKLYSAGVDGYLALSYYPPKTLVKYPPVLQGPIISVAPEHKLIMLRYHTYLEICKLATENRSMDDETYTGLFPLTGPSKKLICIKSKNDENIVCAAMSPDAGWLIYSTTKKLHIYHLSLINDETIDITRVEEITEDCDLGFRVVFSQCSTKVILATFKGHIQIIGLSRELNRATLLQTISHSKELKDTINILTLSPCGKYLIATDTSGGIAIWTEENSKKKEHSQWIFHCVLPKYHCPATALSIQVKPSIMVAVYADQRIIEYNIQGRKFTEFSSLLATRNTRKWLGRYLPILGVAHDPRAKNIIILYDDSAIYIINKAKDLPELKTKIPRIESPIGDTEAQNLNKDHGIRILKKYKHLLYFNFVKEDEFIAVEVNPLLFIELLPPCLKTKQFGTM